MVKISDFEVTSVRLNADKNERKQSEIFAVFSIENFARKKVVVILCWNDLSDLKARRRNREKNDQGNDETHFSFFL